MGASELELEDPVVFIRRSGYGGLARLMASISVGVEDLDAELSQRAAAIEVVVDRYIAGQRPPGLR